MPEVVDRMLADGEPVEEAAEGAGSRTPALTVTRAVAGTVPVRPVSEGAAKRPQPQHKPRSQRRG